YATVTGVQTCALPISRQQIVREVEVEGPADANYRQLEQHEPDAPHQQEAGQIMVLAAVEERACAREEDEGGRHEMRHPAGEEDPRGRATGWQPGIDTDMIDGHQDHHRAANQIDRGDAGGGSDWSGGGG